MIRFRSRVTEGLGVYRFLRWVQSGNRYQREEGPSRLSLGWDNKDLKGLVSVNGYSFNRWDTRREPEVGGQSSMCLPFHRPLH